MVNEAAVPCPRCARSMVLKAGAARIAFGCQRCGGAWLPGESMPADIDIGAALGAASAATGAPGRSRRSCPQCVDAAMHLLIVHGVELDVCRGCHGLYFDAGEFEHVVADIAREHQGTSFDWQGASAAEAVEWFIEEAVCWWYS